MLELCVFKIIIVMRRIHHFISISTISAIALVAIVTGYFYTSYATRLMIEHEGRANRDLTQIMERVIWQEFRVFIQRSKGMNPQQLLVQPEISQLDDVVRYHMKYTNILKVKLYNLDGLTIFSTQAEQIGNDKSDNQGFQDARDGKVRSYLAFRSEFHAFEKMIVDRDIISSYVPLRAEEEGTPVGVVEVYSDVTELVSDINKSQWIIVVSGFSGFVFLFLVVQWVSARVARTMSEHAEEHNQVAQLAFTDTLTGLPNRSEFNSDLEKIIINKGSSGSEFGLLYIDLDGFKSINDKHGHLTGDEVLKHVGSSIRGSLRASDTVYRVGGDEFTVILRGLNRSADAGVVAEKLITEIAKPIACKDTACKLTASVGVAFLDEGTTSIDQLVHAADKAMYVAKQTGANQYRMA
ncbi:MAG: GGDEF domain-containing protein [Gammaproteobacteria bacterium]|nr:GGDEF domain-containing protein [Gammaproteobacteria bacterium]